MLDEAVPLSEPIPMRGAGGLWRLSTVASWATNEGENGRWQLDERHLSPGERALEQWRKGRAAR